MGKSTRRAAKRLAVVGAAMGLSLLLPTLIAGSGVAAGHPPIIRLRAGTSSNWSGYAAFGGAGSFTSVAGSWTQPAVKCTTTNAYSAYWVGLDGDNDNTVEQLGTEADCINGAPIYSAWYEMYPHQSFPISPLILTVVPTHTYTASVTATGGHGNYTLRLKDMNTGATFTTLQRLSQAQDASAEAVVEAPYSGGVLPLADYTTVGFSGVTANGRPLGSFSPNLDPITMDNPHGMKSTPTAIDGSGDFSVNWSAS